MPGTHSASCEGLIPMLVASIRKQASARKGRRGFTLVELLVVIAVIGVLSAILFPVLVKAKEGARITQCLSNIRQIGVGLNAYMARYDDHFPAAIPWGKTVNPDDKTIQELLSSYVQTALVREQDSGLYVKAGVFACPSDTGIPRVDDRGHHWDMVNGVPADKVVWRYTGCSYEYYASDQEDWLNGDSNPPRIPWTGLSPEVVVASKRVRVGAPMSSVMHQTRKAVLGDIWFWHMGDQVPVELLAYRDTLFADGHAARVRGATHLQSRLEPLRQWHTFQQVQ